MKIQYRITSFLLLCTLLLGCVTIPTFAIIPSTIKNESTSDALTEYGLDIMANGVISPDELSDGYVDSVDIVHASSLIEGEDKFGFDYILNADERIIGITENNNYYLGLKGKTAAHNNSAYFDVRTSYNSATNLLNHLDSREGKKSIVISVDLKFNYEITQSINLLNVMSYVQKTNDSTTSASDLKAMQLNLVKISPEGYLMYRNGEVSSGTSYITTSAQLNSEDFSTVAVHIRPEAGDFGLYDLYVNGLIIEKDIRLLTENESEKATWTINDITAKGAKSFLVGIVRYVNFYKENEILSIDGDEEKVILNIDNPKVYFSEKYVECAEHKFKQIHVHDFIKEEFSDAFICHCGEALERTVAIDADKNGLCDGCGIKVLDKNGNGIISPDNLNEYINETNILYSSVLSAADAPKYGFTTFNDASERFVQVTDGNNFYLSLKGKEANNHNATNFNYQTVYGGSTQNFYNNFTNRDDKSFVISMDIKLHDKLSNRLTLLNLTNWSKKASVDANPTAYSDLTNWSLDLLFVSKDGNIVYRDGSTGKNGTISDKSYNLLGEDFRTVSVHIRPEDGEYGLYDIYVDGKSVVKDIQFFTETENALTKWTIEGKTSNGAKSFLPGRIIFFSGLGKGTTLYSDTTKDAETILYSIDNPKIYFSENYVECVQHEFIKISHVHNESNGKMIDTYACHCGEMQDVILPMDSDTNCLCDGCNEEVVTVIARQVFLDDLIGLKIYVSINKKFLSNPDNKAIFTVDGEVKEIFLKDVVPNSNGLHEFEIQLTSIQMAQEVSLAFEIEGVLGEAYTTSVKNYAETLINDENQTEKTRVLAKALLNYGAGAQEYFAVKNEDETLDDTLANAGLSEADKAVEALTAADLAAYKFYATGMTDDVQFTGATLTFSSKTYMKVYFKASADATVTVNGKTYAKTEDNGQYYVTVTAATPAEAMTAFAFVITDGDTTASSNISIFTAVHAGLANSSTDANLVALITAYARYCQLADAYIA